MPDWNSPGQLALQGAAFVKLAHVTSAVYFWEMFISIHFDYYYIRRMKRFQYPMIFYFLVRYVTLATMVCMLVAFDTSVQVNCQPLFVYLQVGGNGSGGLATINFALRTMAIWNRSLYVVIPLTLLILGHWSLILQAPLLDATWTPGVGCTVTNVNIHILSATFIYSMTIDLVVILLSGWKLRKGRHQGLVGLLFQDGLMYFVSSFCANLLATVFMLLNLSPIMSIMFNLPAVVTCSIVSCRAIRSLAKYAADGPHIYYAGTMPAENERVVFNTLPVHRSAGLPQERRASGVHVQKETIVTFDDTPSIDQTLKPVPRLRAAV